MSHSAKGPGSRGLRCSLPMARRRPLAAFALFWAVGAGIGSSAGAPWWFWLPLAGAFLLACILSRRFAALLCAAMLASAALIAALGTPPEPVPREKASVTGVVCAEPRRYDDSLSLVLREVTIDGEPVPWRLRVYLYVRGGEARDLLWGDRVSLEGARVSVPKGQTGEDGYDQRAVLWRTGIGATASAGMEGAVLREGPMSPMRAAAFARRAIAARLDVLFPRHSALAKALLLGDKSGLSAEEYADFQDAGIVHLLAVSGLHVSALASAVELLLRRGLRISRRASYAAVLPLLAVYAALTGFPPSILRASLLFAVMGAAPLLGRPADPVTGLAAVYLLLAVCMPLRQFEPGFLLSFGSVLALCTLGPALEAALLPRGHGPVARVLRPPLRLFLASASVLVGTLPAAAWCFGGVTLWSLLANLLAIPLATAALPTALAGTVLSCVWLPLGKAVCAGAEVLLGWIRSFAGALSGLGGGRLFVSLPRMAPLFLALYAAVCAAVCPQRPRRKGVPKRRAARLRAASLLLLVPVTACAVWFAQAPVRSEQGLRITYTDVGQGDSALCNAQGRLYMVDTGRGFSSADRLAARAVGLEGLFLTHPDLDHVGGLADVLSAGSPRTVFLPECWSRMDVAPETEAALEGRSVRLLSRGDVIALSEDVVCQVLHPPAGYVPAADNEGSLALLLRYGDGSALFLGDLPDDAVSFPLPDADVLLLAHHGSVYSSGERLLLSVSPSAAVVSVGTNGFGHPAAEVLERLTRLDIPVFRTDQCGDISVHVGQGGALTVDRWLDPEAKEG